MRWPGSKPKQDVASLEAFESLAAAGETPTSVWPRRVLRRLEGALRKYPTLAKPVDYVASVWRKLVDAFCETIDPWLSRIFPDLRLTAVVTATGSLDVHRVTKQGVTGLGPLAALSSEQKAGLAQTKWSSVEVRLRPAQVLQRTLSLPSASGEFIGPIIEHRLERLTPWRPDNVLYGYRIDETKPGETMSVALLAVSKDALAGVLGRLNEAGLKPTAVGVDDGALSKPLRVTLRQDGGQAMRLDSRKTVSRVALATLSSLALVYLVTQSLESSASQAEQVVAAKLLKGRRLLKGSALANVEGRERALLNAKAASSAMVVLLDKLANAIPEDTYLKELSIAPNNVRFVGSSVNAPALVGKLEATGLVNVRFSSAITRGKDQRDSFEITADRAPRSGTPDK